MPLGCSRRAASAQQRRRAGAAAARPAHGRDHAVRAAERAAVLDLDVGPGAPERRRRPAHAAQRPDRLGDRRRCAVVAAGARSARWPAVRRARRPTRFAPQPVTYTSRAVRVAQAHGLAATWRSASLVTQQVVTTRTSASAGAGFGVPVGGQPLTDGLGVGQRDLAAEELDRERRHPRNPISRRVSAAATIAAVSVRRTTGPNVATATPRSPASWSSASEKPGSGRPGALPRDARRPGRRGRPMHRPG